MKKKITKSSRYQLKYQRNLRNKLKARGLCLYCCQPLKDKDKAYVRCSSCRAKVTKARLDKIRKLRMQGLCICGKPIKVRRKDGMCKDCWFKNIAKNRTGSRKNWLAIKKLLEKQNYRCIYTGKKLIIGKNASLDHIIPTSKDGDNSIENLQWLDLQINVMKNNMSHQEFISTIKLILKKQSLQGAGTLAPAMN